MTVQIARSRAYHADVFLVMAGTNDIVTYHHTLEQIVCNYQFLLEEVPAELQLIVTLIPYTSFPEYTDNIRIANSEIRRLSERKGADIIDINSRLSNTGILEKELPTDGVHCTQRSYHHGVDEILKRISCARNHRHPRVVRAQGGVSLPINVRF